jgi:transposase
VPDQLRVIIVRRPKYACRACEEVVVQAPAPARVIEGGPPTEATVARVLVNKYADHLSLYRETQIYSRRGMNLERSTLADRVGRATGHLRPVIWKVTIESALPADAFSLALDDAGYAATAA